MSDSEEIVCKPTKWFLWRAIAMSLMFLVGAAWFYRDYKWGYPQQNVERYHYLAFDRANDEYKKRSQDGLTASQWEEFASEQKIYVAGDVADPKEVLPAGTDMETMWPVELVNYESYKAAYEENAGQAIPPGWKKFANSGGRKWSEEPGREVFKKSTIDQQLYIAILCLLLLIGALYLALRTIGRTMKVDAKGFTPPGGKLIPYSAMRKIDARKWYTKGLAIMTYDEGGKYLKARADGFVYGGFNKDEGEPAERLYQRILANFKGELIEVVRERTDDSEGGICEK